MLWNKQIFLLAFLWAVPSLSVADGKKTAALDVILLNSLDLKNELQAIGANIDLSALVCDNGIRLKSDLNSESALCKDLGHGCLINTYLDKPQMVFEGTAGSDSCNASEGAQLVLNGLLGQVDKVSKSKAVGVFKKDHYFNLSEKIKESQNTVNSRYASWVSNEIPDSAFVSACMMNPMAFPSLKGLYTGEKDTHRLSVFNDLFAQALILSVRSLQAGTNPGSFSYPFRTDVMQNAAVYPIDDLYQQLKSINAWPQFKSLNEEERNTLGGVYLRKTKDGTTWLVKAVYSSTDNVVWLDYSLPYYENVYVLAHELWHVAYAHTSDSNAELSALAAKLDSPEMSDESLKNAIFKMVSHNELLAIQQQNLLYHGMGPYTADWSDEQSSARRWHDSYFGDKSQRLLKSRSERRAFAGESPGLEKFDPGFGYLISLGRLMAHTPSILRENGVSQSINDDYWADQVRRHHLFFDQIYLKSDFDFTHGERPQANIVVDQQPWVMPLTCEKVRRLNRILGPNWELGIPFSSSVQEDCSHPTPGQPGVEGGHPGVEGGHPGVEGGHPGLEGFPSLEAPSDEEISNTK